MSCCGGFGIYCEGNSLAMNTVTPNPSVSQSQGCCCGGCGGAGSLSSTLNAIGKWGTALTGVIQGKPVATGKSGVAVGARGSTSLTGAPSLMSILIFVVIIGVIFLALK